jgi:hypothetical protein
MTTFAALHTIFLVPFAHILSLTRIPSLLRKVRKSPACSFSLTYRPLPAGFIPGDPTAFVVSLSERLAEFAPELTIDFISEVSIGIELVGDRSGGKPGDKALSRTNTAQRINCLQYMSPWVKNLTHFANPTSPHYEHSGARLRDCVRILSDLTIADSEVRPLKSYVTRCFKLTHVTRLRQRFRSMCGQRSEDSTVLLSTSYWMSLYVVQLMELLGHRVVRPLHG